MDWVFITNGRQRVKVNNPFSTWAPVLSGSLLGPVLSIIYRHINDLIEDCTAGCDIYLHADDAKLFKHISCETDCVIMQTGITRAIGWTDDF